MIRVGGTTSEPAPLEIQAAVAALWAAGAASEVAALSPPEFQNVVMATLRKRRGVPTLLGRR